MVSFCLNGTFAPAHRKETSTENVTRARQMRIFAFGGGAKHAAPVRRGILSLDTLTPGRLTLAAQGSSLPGKRGSDPGHKNRIGEDVGSAYARADGRVSPCPGWQCLETGSLQLHPIQMPRAGRVNSRRLRQIQRKRQERFKACHAPCITLARVE